MRDCGGKSQIHQKSERVFQNLAIDLFQMQVAFFCLCKLSILQVVIHRLKSRREFLANPTASAQKPLSYRLFREIQRRTSTESSSSEIKQRSSAQQLEIANKSSLCNLQTIGSRKNPREIDLLTFLRFVSYAHCDWLLLYNRCHVMNTNIRRESERGVAKKPRTRIRPQERSP